MRNHKRSASLKKLQQLMLLKLLRKRLKRRLRNQILIRNPKLQKNLPQRVLWKQKLLRKK